jgi:dienelactone hydrolase
MISSSVEYASAGRAFVGVVVSDPSVSGKRPGVLVFHGGAGLGDHERERAQMLAERGYVAFAPDLFGEKFDTRAQGMAVIQGLVAEPAILRERVNAALGWLCDQPGIDEKRIVHGGALHGFTEPALDPAKHPGCAYHPGADHLSWRAMHELFDQAMGPTTPRS